MDNSLDGLSFPVAWHHESYWVSRKLPVYSSLSSPWSVTKFVRSSVIWYFDKVVDHNQGQWQWPVLGWTFWYFCKQEYIVRISFIELRHLIIHCFLEESHLPVLGTRVRFWTIYLSLVSQNCNPKSSRRVVKHSEQNVSVNRPQHAGLEGFPCKCD